MKLKTKISITSSLLARSLRSGDPTEFRAFFRKNASRFEIAELSSSNRCSVNGWAAEKLAKSEESGSAGMDNDGVFFYTAADGTPRALKILKLDPVTLEAEEASPMVKELANAYVGEWFEGPKIYGFGIATINGKARVAIDMERLFPYEEFMTTKDFRKMERDKRWHQQLWKMRDHFPGGDEFVRVLARTLMKPFFQGIAPVDPDFAIDAKGRLRWMDTGSWSTLNANKEELFRRYEDVLQRFFPCGHRPGEPAFVPEEAAAATVFLHEVFREIKQSNDLKAAEKRRFVEILFEDRDDKLRFGLTKNLVLYEIGLSLSPDGAGVPAAARALRIYDLVR